ncbi:MAG: GC-type dockerin domain-anchored protein [Phycisphaerales bacterium]
MSHLSRRLLSAGVVLGLPAALAQAQIGPDVIVGELPDVAFYTSSGAINGLHAYAVGTLSCNLGDAPLEWISSTNRHPVISQNMYRLMNGRFEHIGQAFLKHGFTALQGNVCSTCTPYPNGSHLGVGCSDPYSASLNGSQSGLGPKFEVNAATGLFPYPFSNLPGSGALNRRLQVRQSDLALPGALYFVASRYVAPDDTEAGNDDNNQSYRRVTINANYSLSLQDTTQRTKPAIQAWRDHGGGAGVADPNVMLTNVDVPTDGRLIVGSRAYDTGTGTYRYEFAVQNANSDRSAGMFSIPIPAGATITNIGFHDVDYHSGEPYDLTDWTPSVSSTQITWSTQTYPQNQNANALRWDTIYSFWFETDSAPVSGTATLGLFRPGTPTSVTAAAWVPSGGPPPPPQPPANDNCASAATVIAGGTSFTTINATTDGLSETLCTINGSSQVENDVWFRYTSPSCAGTVSISTCGSLFDTRLAVYNAACPAAADSAIACNDDSASCGTGSLQSSLAFTAAASTQYLIRVGGTAGATGNGTLNIAGPACGPVAPPNDACASAIPLTSGVTVAGTTVNATNDGTASCGTSSSSPDVWYSYTPASTATVSVSTCNNASYDTVLSIHSGCGGSQIACVDDTSGCGLTTTVSATLTGGTTYLIRVAGYNGATGTFNLTATGGAAPPPGPANDSCDNRIGIPLGTIAFNTTGATTDGPAHASCASNNQTLITNDIWYNHPSQASGTLTVSTCGSSYDTWIAVYDDYGCLNFDSRLMACSDDFACPGGGTTQSQVAVSVQSGRSYTIRVGGFNGATGAGQLTLSLQSAVSDNILVAFDSTTSVPGVGAVENEDIVEYNPASNTWTMLFDGSDVGLAGFAISGFAQTSAGDILLSFTTAGTIPGMTGGPGGSTTLDDSDIVRFVPTALGATTAGSFVFYFDGSDVGLTQNSEDIDALAIAPDGRLVISTSGSASATGVSSAQDEDLIIFTPTNLGSTTSGTFAFYFDGSDVGLSNNNGEDVVGAAFAPNNDLLLATLDNFSVAGLAGSDNDVIRFAPTSLGSVTAGTFSLYRALTSAGISAAAGIADIDVRTSAFVKGGPGGLPCPADLTADGHVDSQDFFTFLAAFFAQNPDADFNRNGLIDSQDFFDFLALYLAGCN